MRRPIGQPGLKNVSKAISSIVLPNVPIALISSPCDFFPFSDLKAKRNSEQFDIMEEFQRRAEELLGQVTSDTIRRVYEHWIERLNQMISTNGDHLER
jgi:hypothetical protein